MMIDEASRYRLVDLIKTKLGPEISRVLLRTWFRYFGSPRNPFSDQEGGITSEQFGLVCDLFSVYKRLAGVDQDGCGRAGGRHSESYDVEDVG